MSKEWTIGVIPGPHCTEEFLQPEYLQQLTDTKWEVHFNSSRTGVRLIGPAPFGRVKMEEKPVCIHQIFMIMPMPSAP